MIFIRICYSSGYVLLAEGSGLRRYLLLIVCNFVLFFIAGKLILPEEPVVSALKYRFTFVSSQEWPQMGKGIRSADADLGTDTRCLASKSSTVEKQTALVYKAIYANVDGIITTGSDYSEGLAEAVSEAEKKGIPVFLVEADLEDSGRTCYIGPDHFASGVQAGRDMVDACAGEAKVAVIVSSREDGNEMRRLEGFRSITEQFPEMEIVYLLENAGDKLQTKTLLLRMLEENPQINAIYCAEPTASVVVGEALRSEGFGPADFVIVGYGMS